MRTPRFYLWIAVSFLAILAVAFGSNAHSQLHTRPPAATTAEDHDYDSSEPLKEQETIHKSFSLPAGERSLEIDNVNGSIEVTGSQTNEVQVVVNKTIRARSQEKLELARKEVSLDATQEGGAVKLYVNGPFRCHGDCPHENHGYSVSMNFQVQAPRDVAVKLKSVNGGVEVKDVSGKYSIHTVNGKIRMENVAASGVAHTVNGAVKISYRDNPRENSEFASVNGGIELYFVPGLSADFHFKNLNGGIFTDFPMTALSDSGNQGEMHDGKFVYRGHEHVAGRIGAGGPEIKAENVNGSIRVLERHD